MSTFIGTYEYNVDDKARFPIHKVFRDQLPEDQKKFAMVPWMDGCLAMFPVADMQEFQARFRRDQSFASPEARLFQRKVMYGASLVEPDAQGRVTLNQIQMTHAGLSKGSSLMLLGQMDRIEVWSPERLNEQLNNVDQPSFDALAGGFFQPPSTNGSSR